jgi:dUTPase
MPTDKDYESLLNIVESLNTRIDLLEKEREIPFYNFALREDLKDCLQFLPTKGEPNATGWDVRCAMKNRRPLVIKPGQYVKIPLGFRAFLPKGYWYELKPRSSSFAKKSLHALYGTIDETFENELIFACVYNPDITSLCSDLVIEFGEAIAQIIPVKRQEMTVIPITNEQYDENCKLRDSVRKDGGFGSTAK